jgi:hypothetical protein
LREKRKEERGKKKEERRKRKDSLERLRRQADID